MRLIGSPGQRNDIALAHDLIDGSPSLRPACTRKAVAAAKARGKKLGGFRGRAGTAEDAAKARKARTAKVLGHAESLAPIITRLDPDGSALKTTFVRPIPRDPRGRLWLIRLVRGRSANALARAVVVDRLIAQAGESYSDVIVRLAIVTRS